MLAAHDYGGNGRDVLLMHGGADNLETWRDFVGLLQPGFRLVAYDARGHGQSLTPDEASSHYLHWDAPGEVARRIRELA
jgi:pimeloyl-ACP methyl ester carboxylesterase